MRKNKTAFIFSFILLLLFSSSLSSHSKDVFTTTLRNGLKVILLEEHKAPVVTFQIWYRVGSRNEVTGKTGLSHLTEHMMFKGTEKYGKGAFSRIVAENGGTENAFTSKNYTAYFENLSNERYELSMDLEADRMVNLLLDPREFELERDVVKEERRLRTEDNPTNFLVENLYAMAFMVHPYHHPVIGWMSDLNHLSHQDVAHHYKTYYSPNNAIIVMVGDFEIRKALPKIKHHFEDIPVKPDPPAVGIREPEQLGERRILIKKEAELPFFMVGFRTPNFKTPSDSFPLTLLDHILSSGKSSRLYSTLVYEQQLALEIGGDYSDLTTDPELLYVYGVLQKGTSPEAFEKALLAQLEKIKQEGVTEKELQKAKNQVEASWIMGQDSNFFQAMRLGIAETVGAGIPFYENYVDRIRGVSREEVQRVARKYLLAEHRTVGILLPRSSESEP